MHPILVTVINFLMSLSILIVLHELGHFIPARLFKTRVEKFYLFFDIKFSLFKKKIGETVYGIGWLPLGGYVKIAGMIDESMDKEQMAKPPQPWEFRSKPAWQRLIIMLGGVIVNVIVGFVIYICLMYANGKILEPASGATYGFGYPKVLEEVGFQQGDLPILVDNQELERAPSLYHNIMFRDVETVTVLRDGKEQVISIPEDTGSKMFQAGVRPILLPRRTFVVDTVADNTPAAKMGMKSGAVIKSIAGYPINYDSDYEYALLNKTKVNEEFEVVWEIDGETKSGTTSFGTVTETNFWGVESEVPAPKVLGIRKGFPDTDIFDSRVQDLSFGEAVSEGISKGWWTMRDYVSQFKYIFTSKGASQLGGFGTIAKMYPDTFNWTQFWGTTALISFILAIMNILPIPALDGGHVAFLLYEIVTGRKPGDKFLERAQIIGILLLLGLLLYANGNDVVRAITG